MPSPYNSLKTQASFGVESTPGTGVSTTVGTRVKAVDLQAKATHNPVEDLYGDGTSAVASDSFLSMVDVSGNLRLNACYQGGALGMILYALMGTVVDAGAGPYTHTFTVSDPKALTVDIERGNSAKDEIMQGCKPSKFSLSVQPGQVAEVSVDFVGMTATARGTNTPVAPATPYLVKHSHVGTLGFDSATYTQASFTLTVDTKAARLDQLGSAYSDEPVRTGMTEVTLEVEIVGRTNALQVAALAGTQGNVTCTITDGTRSLAITLHNAKVVSYSDPITTVGVIRQRVTFRGHGDGTNHGLAIVLTNSDATYGVS